MSPSNLISPADLATYTAADDIPQPKFKLFDVAVLYHQCKDGRQCEDLIQILGVSWNPNDHMVSGWCYHFRYLQQPTCDSWLSAGRYEDCMEDQLKPAPISLY